MARKDNTALASIAEPMSAEETSLMDADRDSEHASPEPELSPEPAPEPVVEVQPELALETDDRDPEPVIDPADIDPKTGRARKVDYGAFHAQKMRTKAAEAEAKSAREEAAKLLGRFETIQQLVQRQQQPPSQVQQPVQDEIPDINLDPVGHFQAKDAIRERELTELRQWRQAEQQKGDTYNNITRLQQIAQNHEVEFKKTTPDYDDAFQFVRAQRDVELQGMGYDDPSVRQQIIQQDALQIAAQALQGNKNAAQVVYAIAKARGYAGKAPAPAPIPAPVVVKSPDTQKLQTVAKGQKETQSLGQVNGEAMPDLSPQAIANMSDAEFAKWATDDNFRKLMGG